VQAIHPQTDTGDKKQPIYNLFAAYMHTIPLEELIESVERWRRVLKVITQLQECAESERKKITKPVHARSLRKLEVSGTHFTDVVSDCYVQ
jgi:hypothetical protein